MAQSSQQQEPVSPVDLMPKSEQDALALLTQELNSQITTFSQEGAAQLPVAEKVADSLLMANPAASTVINNASLGYTESGSRLADSTDLATAYQGIIGSGQRVVRIIPKGQSDIASKAGEVTQQVTDPNSGETIVFTKSPEQIMANTNKVAAAIVNAAGGDAQRGFNLQTAMEKVRTLKGADALTYTMQTIANIDVQLAAEMKRIGQQAAMESGYTNYRAAYERNVLLDNTTPGFMQKSGGNASGQTLLAMQTMTHALEVSKKLEHGLAGEDANIAALLSAKNELLKIEVRSAAGQERRDAIAEDKMQQIRDVVGPKQLTNYHYLEGTSGNTDTDLKRIAAMAYGPKADPVLKQLINADPSNIHDFLASGDSKVREGALKLILAYDKAANPKYADAVSTPTSKMVTDMINDPALIKKMIAEEPNADAKSALNTAYTMAQKSGKDMAAFREKYLPIFIARQVEKGIRDGFGDNVNTWTGPGVKDGGPLAKAIAIVSATNPKGTAPLGTVVDTFIASKDNGPDNKPLDFNSKVTMLIAAINGTAMNTDKNLIITPDAVDGIRTKLVNDIKNRAARAYVRSVVTPFNTEDPFVNFLGPDIGERYVRNKLNK